MLSHEAAERPTKSREVAFVRRVPNKTKDFSESLILYWRKYNFIYTLKNKLVKHCPINSTVCQFIFSGVKGLMLSWVYVLLNVFFIR